MMENPARRRSAAASVFLAMALVVVDAGMTNAALPKIAQSLGIDPATSILVTSAYQLALVIGLLPAAHVAERLGGRRLFIIGVFLFTTASAFAAAAPSLPLLVAARFLQGMGGAAILGLGMSLLWSVLGIDGLGSAIAWNALNVAFCAAAGPTLGAIIVTVAGWRWLYVLDIPLGLFAMAAALALPRTLRSSAPVDWTGIALHVVGATSLFLAFDRLIERPVLAGILAGMGVVGFALLVRRERPKASPLIPLDLLDHRPFQLAVGASISCFIAQSAGLVALPFYLHNILSMSMLSTGLILACWPLAVAVTSPWANRLSKQLSSSILCASGAVILAVGLIGASLVPVQTNVAPLVLCSAVCGIGFGLFQVPNNRNLFLSAPPERSAAAGGVQATARLTGQTLGAILVSSLFALSSTEIAPRVAMMVAGASALAAALLSALRVTAASSQPSRT